MYNTYITTYSFCMLIITENVWRKLNHEKASKFAKKARSNSKQDRCQSLLWISCATTGPLPFCYRLTGELHHYNLELSKNFGLFFRNKFMLRCIFLFFSEKNSVYSCLSFDCSHYNLSQNNKNLTDLLSVLGHFFSAKKDSLLLQWIKPDFRSGRSPRTTYAFL